MKLFLLASLILSATALKAQSIITPNKKILEGTELKDKHFDLDWNMINDSNKINVGSVHIDMMKNNNQYVIITTTKLARFPDANWIDSSICESSTLSPIYHSSYNMQRDMVLHFGKTINGYYFNKKNDSSVYISDSIESPYFDSNIYQWLMCLLPLHERQNQRIPMYDYNPSQSGLVYAQINEVRKGNYFSPISGNHKVWIVNTEDNISGSKNNLLYYIDRQDHRFWKMEVKIGNKKMEQVLHE